MTDYPDAALVENMQHNVELNTTPTERDRTSVQGYIWGRSADILLETISPAPRFDLIILSDLIFNHSQHSALLDSCKAALSKSQDACVLVFFTHHRPHLADADMGFFQLAKQRGWNCDEILEKTFPVSIHITYIPLSFFSLLLWLCS